MGDPLLTVALFSAVSAAMYVAIGLYLFNLCNIGYKKFFMPLIVGTLKSLPYLAPIFLATIFIASEILIIAVALLVGTAFLWQKQKVFKNLTNAEY